jgi:voltage-gated potassium channel
MTLRKKIYLILEKSGTAGTVSWYVDLFLVVLITLNVLAIILESVAPIYNHFADLFHRFEVFSVAVFTVEYVLRVWTCREDSRYSKPIVGNVKYMFSLIGLIDLLAFIYFYLPFLGFDMRFVRGFRMFRLFRLFKIARYVNTLKLMERVVREKRTELLITFVFTLLILLLSSSLMYYVEHNSHSEGFESIPETMWWGIATLTTVGYGDVTPITPLGKIFGGIIALIGIGLFALPAGILAGGFSDEIVKERKIRENLKHGTHCPTCGKKL